MSFVGMDLAAIELLQRQLDGLATEMDQLGRRADQRVRGSATIWRGPDRDRFEQDWHQDLYPLIRQSHSALLDAVAELGKQIAEQRTASQADATDSVGGSPGHATPSTGENKDDPAAGLNDEWRDVFHKAQLADAACKSGDAEAAGVLPPGWILASPADLGLDSKDFVSSSGLRTRLLKGPNGDYVLSFTGSEDLNDWEDNFVGAFGVSVQQAEAINLARRVDAAVAAQDGRLEFVGYSLGGGLASAASLATGRRATTFNAAGLSPDTIAVAKAARGGLSEELVSDSVVVSVLTPPALAAASVQDAWMVFDLADKVAGDPSQAQITHYIGARDPLSSLQMALPVPNAVGAQYLLPETGSASPHDLTSVMVGIREAGRADISRL